MTQILILNGPNLNLLGHRQPEVYGRETLADVVKACTALGRDLGLEVVAKQSTTKARWSTTSTPRARGLPASSSTPAPIRTPPSPSLTR